MYPTLTGRTQQAWLACPTTRTQTDAYWQAVAPWRAMGIELVLHPIGDTPEAQGPRWWLSHHWQGLVLWPDAGGRRLWAQARKHGVQVRCLAPDPRQGLQPWSGD